MRTNRVYKQAIRRVFGEKFHDNRMAVYWGRDDDTINVIASQRHYVCRIADVNEDTLEFVSTVGDRVTVALTDEERRQLERRDNAGALLRGYAKDKDGNLSLVGTMSIPHSRDKPCPRERKDKRDLVRRGATVFKKETVG
jgi:hypothetical protein